MKKVFTVIAAWLSLAGFAQVTNIYQPNGSTTNFGKVASDSLNYYVVNYPALTLMKIDPSNVATLVTTLTVDPFQTMIFNNGKGIFPVSNGAPFKLFDGTSQIDISGGQLPLAGFTGDKVIAPDYFHKGNVTYFRTNNKIYKTDYSSPASIVTLASVDYSVGTTEMQHTTNSILFSDVVISSSVPSCIKRIDLITGTISKIDSSITGTYDYGTVWNDEYYYCTPYGPASAGNSSIYKISDAGVKTVLYTETVLNKHFQRIVGVTPNGVIALMTTVSVGTEYVSVSGGVVTPLNFNTVANSRPCGSVGVGTSRTTNSLVYFRALDTLYTVSSSNNALWVTDGTLAGTKKIIGGTPTTFSADGLSTQFPGDAEHCGDDLYFKGFGGSPADRLIYVNGSTNAVTTYPYGLPSTQPSIRKIENGIVLIGSPLPTTSAEKAVFKANCSSLSSINDNAGSPILLDVYPNPNNGRMTIELKNNSEAYTLNVFNLLGELIHTERMVNSITELHLDVKAGFYFITVQNSTGQKGTKKIIVQ
ncbi:MAG: T9SS type A sorting domain-containing protein [Bacteroidetes bacterium]|nr:T9SS type A sorting domain-containing protein [Bacteroidota bacterium]